jgi:hypothetical protein
MAQADSNRNPLAPANPSTIEDLTPLQMRHAIEAMAAGIPFRLVMRMLWLDRVDPIGGVSHDLAASSTGRPRRKAA